MTSNDPDNPAALGRRTLFAAGTAGLAFSAASGGPALAQSSPPAIDTGVVRDGRVSFPNWRGEAEAPSPPPPAPLPPDRRVGFALVGLGRLTLEELLPAFGECRHARPVALVSGTPEKARLVAAQYGIKPEAVYGYADMRRLRDNPEVRAVYVVTPNSLHREQVEAAAAAGKHVLCEKPMAVSSVEARAMIAACDAARVKLMVAYRIQYEPHNREVIRLLRSGELGAARLIETNNCQVQGSPEQWRLRKALAGGGSLPDIGIYCLNTARALTGEEPVEVFARIHNPPNDPRFAEVEDTVSFMLRFPSGTIANCATSYSAFNSKDLRVQFERGWADLENAYAYRGQRLRVAKREGNGQVVEQPRIRERNQFALEMDHFARCILEDRRPRTPGEEGLRDHLAMEAIYRSAAAGQPVAMEPVVGLDASRGPEAEKAG
jgi:predicted dehydrogenase